jgi:hypothetical protein
VTREPRAGCESREEKRRDREAASAIKGRASYRLLRSLLQRASKTQVDITRCENVINDKGSLHFRHTEFLRVFVSDVLRSDYPADGDGAGGDPVSTVLNVSDVTSPHFSHWLH